MVIRELIGGKVVIDQLEINTVDRDRICGSDISSLVSLTELIIFVQVYNFILLQIYDPLGLHWSYVLQCVEKTGWLTESERSLIRLFFPPKKPSSHSSERNLYPVCLLKWPYQWWELMSEVLVVSLKIVDIILRTWQSHQKHLVHFTSNQLSL